LSALVDARGDGHGGSASCSAGCGGVLVLTGTLLLPRKPDTGCVLTAIGCVAGLLPTMWTVVVPLMLVALAIATAKRAAAAVDRETTPR